MVMYAESMDAQEMEPAVLAERLAAVLRDAMPWLVTISEEMAVVPEAEGKWSAKQVIGHLTDSAVNNLGRVVRMQQAERQSMPGYEQNAWVALGHYQERPWSEVLALWFAMNEHMGWLVKHIDQPLLANEGVVAGGAVTLGFLIADYVAHMEHHLRLMRPWVVTA